MGKASGDKSSTLIMSLDASCEADSVRPVVTKDELAHAFSCCLTWEG